MVELCIHPLIQYFVNTYFLNDLWIQEDEEGIILSSLQEIE